MKGSRELECADCAGQRFRVVLQTASEKSFVTLGSDLGSLEVETRRGSAPGHPRICIKAAAPRSFSIILLLSSSPSGKSDAFLFLSQLQNAFAF